MTTISIIIIGDEILTGKFVDQNTPWLIKRCAELFLDINTVRIIQDQVNTIATVIREESDKSDFVFTTGGVGPTHDDVTMKAVAKAFNMRIVQNKTFAKFISEKVPNDNGALLMANIPEDAELIMDNIRYFPQVKVNNVFIFPGIPKLMQKKFNNVAHLFTGTKKFLQKVHLHCRESKIALQLTTIQQQNKTVNIGSYPQVTESGSKVILTIESTKEKDVYKVKSQILSAFADFVIV